MDKRHVRAQEADGLDRVTIDAAGVNRAKDGGMPTRNGLAASKVLGAYRHEVSIDRERCPKLTAVTRIPRSFQICHNCLNSGTV
jgi:hypothetical protein